jgi:MFS family permease
MSPHHVTAMLEMNGWTDHRSVTLGYSNVFALGATVYDLVHKEQHHKASLSDPKTPLWRSIYRTISLYAAGLSFAMPMLFSSGAVLTMEYSFMSYMGFSVQIATAIALGTFASFIVAGGFSQAIARRGMFYISQNLYTMGRRSSVQLLLIGGAVTIVLGLLVNLFLVVVPILPWTMMRVVNLYYFLLTPIWLGCAILYMMSRTFMINLLFALGIGVVYVSVEYYDLDVMTSHAIGMALIAVTTLIAGVLAIYRMESKAEKAHSQSYVVPRWSQIARSLTPYFLYGILYFTLIFTDRLLSWSVPSAFHPFPIWFLGNYELGLDWALWTLVLPMGLVEVYIHVMFYRLGRRQKTYLVDKVNRFTGLFRRDHLIFSASIFVLGLCGIVLIMAVMSYLVALGIMPNHPLDHRVTQLVFFIAAPSYILVTIGLQGCLILFSFNHPWPAVQIASRALIVNIAVGFFASRYFGSEWAVVGLLCGTAVFAALASREANKLLENLDFHLLKTI